MRERKPLKPNTTLRVWNHAGGEMHFVVGKVVGMGGSCIVYDGFYLNNIGTKNTVRIKECVPYQLHLDRNSDGTLLIPEHEREKFQIYKEKMQRAFDVANELHQSAGLTNLTSNVFDRYEANNTVYIVSSYTEGNTLANIDFETLKDAVRVVISVAKTINHIHDKGYLYLDIKPDNILMYNETPDLIQLFDFDSVIPIDAFEMITEYKISYSVGFAPFEQKKGILSQIGIHSDIYSIGALLFYLLFGRTPKAVDCGSDVEYDYTKIKWDTEHQEKVYKELTTFFHNTLQVCSMDRYPSMSDVVTQLELISKYADLPVPFICSGFVTNGGVVVGREQEFRRLQDWYEGDEKILFVTGMGGIGKSTIVREFINKNRANIEHMIYLQYRDSVYETVADDTQFLINGCEKNEAETVKEYFERKIKIAKEQILDANALLVIDNFDGELDETFTELLDIGWKVIVITRLDMHNFDYPYLHVGRLEEKAELHLLFETNLGRKLKSDEYRKLNRIIDLVAGHTLVLVLIARQIAKSFIDVDMAMQLVEAHGFSELAPERVDYMQDGRAYYDKIATIIMSVYDVSQLSENKKKCMKVLSLFNIPGLDVKAAKSLLKLESLDELNELIDLGWLERSDHNVQMHPLIQETMHQVAWTTAYRAIALDEMQILYKEIKRTPKHKKYLSRVSEKLQQNVIQFDIENLRRQKTLQIAKSVLQNAGKDTMLKNEKRYKNLLVVTLMNLPKDQESYIIRNSEQLFRDHTYQNHYSIMELYDYVVYLQCQKASYKKAQQYLKRAGTFAKQWKNDYISGLYFDMWADFYEALLDGAYYTSNENERALLEKLFLATDKAIYHMGKAKHKNAERFTVKYKLGKAALMIRSVPEHYKKIKKLILSTRNFMERCIPDCTEEIAIYYMVWAWYYTLCEPEQRLVHRYLQRAADINVVRTISKLDEIDYFYIPAANMMCEFGAFEEAMDFLQEACRICEEHGDSIPYIRKKQDLLKYQS